MCEHNPETKICRRINIDMLARFSSGSHVTWLSLIILEDDRENTIDSKVAHSTKWKPVDIKVRRQQKKLWKRKIERIMKARTKHGRKKTVCFFTSGNIWLHFLRLSSSRSRPAKFHPLQKMLREFWKQKYDRKNCFQNIDAKSLCLPRLRKICDTIL